MAEWINKEDDRGFRLEAGFLTGWGVERELRRSNFVHCSTDTNNLKSYLRYWPDGIHAVARVYPRMGAGRLKVAISYYNSRGKKFRKSTLAGK
jgi:hypothetical protein